MARNTRSLLREPYRQNICFIIETFIINVLVCTVRKKWFINFNKILYSMKISLKLQPIICLTIHNYVYALYGFTQCRNLLI